MKPRFLPIAALLLFGGCGSSEDAAHDHAGDHGHDHADGGHDHDDHDHDAAERAERWSATAWGEHFEIFAECDPLAAGQPSRALVRVTALRDFSPLREGLVEIVLRRDGAETTFAEELPVRQGIFDVGVHPTAEGEYDLSFRVEGALRREEIPAGRVRVGSADEPGGIAGFSPGAGLPAETVSFLKEQQWSTEFATTWAEAGELSLVARGPGRVRPVAGGEVVLAAPMNAVVRGEPWPHVGREVAEGERLFQLTPHVAADRSLADLQAGETEKRAALQVAEERLKRLESLLPLQAASPAEVEAARAQVTGLRAQAVAARSDLGTARAGRSGGAESDGGVSVSAPFAGLVAEVPVRPGQVVGAGQTLGRIVRVQPFWVEVFLRPADAVGLDGGSAGLVLRGPGQAEPVTIAREDVRLVSRSPEVSGRSGTVSAIFEVAGSANPLLGSAVEAEVALDETRSGVIVPASSVVDDGGTPVVYVQHGGESFLRREVQIGMRQGSLLIVGGVADGERVVTSGGSTIRRATLASSGVGHGHVH